MPKKGRVAPFGQKNLSGMRRSQIKHDKAPVENQVRELRIISEGDRKMNQHENLQLRDPGITPTCELLEQLLGGSYAAYEALQDALPELEMEQTWQWYTPHKAWFAKGQHFWTTPKGTKKEKTLYWLYVFDEYFDVAVWFKEKNRAEILSANVSEKTKQVILNSGTFGKVPTFPVVIKVTSTAALADIYTLIDWKKRLEK